MGSAPVPSYWRVRPGLVKAPREFCDYLPLAILILGGGGGSAALALASARFAAETIARFFTAASDMSLGIFGIWALWGRRPDLKAVAAMQQWLRVFP